jgi:hypothetical protein
MYFRYLKDALHDDIVHEYVLKFLKNVSASARSPGGAGSKVSTSTSNTTSGTSSSAAAAEAEEAALIAAATAASEQQEAEAANSGGTSSGDASSGGSKGSELKAIIEELKGKENVICVHRYMSHLYIL